ncbi:ABC transporter permease [Acetatifactor muris]|uniref:Aliphatic sulfonates transport permease protein SsuC n=1 Tax=Acetatifactor muris TaxID=879566 RepID=A0A2K4ZDJ1_9FIRM|nr:ABC transporter permease [Acetatifactor muris]MCR2046886.1 ABC transporter permease [Acetatifactor muris]SOY28528.1 Putative aliphatic sulfonates transport permease protein SsuC [Acetatifactor muris]
MKNERKNKKKSGAELTRQEQFVRQHRRHHHEIASWRTVIFVFFLILWEISADMKWIDSFFFSSPSRVLRCFAEQLKGNSLLSHIGVTLFETLFSFLLVLLFSLLVSTLLWYSRKLSEILEPYLVVLNSLPKSALAPLFIVWLGTGTKTIIVAGISVAVFGSIISFYTGFQQVDAEKITLIYTLGGSKRDAFFRVVLPGSIPILLSTAKVNIGLALVGVIIGEFLAARRGLGYLIIYGSQVFQLDMVITSIIILCLIALGLYKSIQLIEHRIKIQFKM